MYDVCYVIAMFAKIMMGFYQVESMAIIIIMLQQKNDQTQLKMIKTVRAIVLLINISALVVMIIEAIEFVKALDKTYSCQRSDPPEILVCMDYFYNYMQILGDISGSYYGVLSVTLIATYAKLNLSLKNQFSEQARGYILSNVRVLFGVLVVSYVLRTIYLFL